MDKDYLQLILTLNECVHIASHAAKNALYMEQNFGGDDTITEYKDKLQRMGQDLPSLIMRANHLRLSLQAFNIIALS